MSETHDNASRALRLLTKPDPYRANPFRILGLSPLAPPRETARRIETLRIAAELGHAPCDWAFAPAEGLDPESIRSAAQTLRDPLARLICEFFWFWPLSYPEPETDEALNALAVADTATAVVAWTHAAPPQSAAALHNLAVYQHRLSLEWEEDPGVAPETLAELRASAVDFWLRTFAAPGLHDLLAARVAPFAGPQIPPSLPATLIAEAPSVLARAHLRLALRHSEADRPADAADHVRLAHLLVPAPEPLAELLAETVEPVAHRIQAAVQGITAAGTPPLETATALIRACAPDLARLHVLLDRSAPAFRTAARALSLAVLDAAVAHQREGGPEHLVLLHLLYLLDQPASPELATRISSAFDIFQANALLAARPAELPAAEALPALDRHLALDLILDTLAPAASHVLALPALARHACHDRLAAWVEALAQAALATGAPAEREWAAATLARARDALSPGAATLARLDATLARIALDRSLALDLEGPANTFTIDAVGVALDGNRCAATALTALRHGADHSETGAGRHLLAWSTTDQADALYLDQLQPTDNADPSLPARVLAAVDHFLVTPLVERLASAIRAGGRMEIGPFAFTAEGIEVESHRLLGRKTILISYAEAKVHTGADGSVLIVAPSHTSLPPSLDPAVVWNAVLIPRLVARLASHP